MANIIYQILPFQFFYSREKLNMQKINTFNPCMTGVYFIKCYGKIVLVMFVQALGWQFCFGFMDLDFDSAARCIVAKIDECICAY